MKTIMKISICILTLLLFVLSGYSQKIDDVPGWQEARWGMTEEELKSTFKDLRKLDKRENFFDGDQYADYQITDYVIEERKYNVFFLMGKESGKLATVLVKLKEPPAGAIQKVLFDGLESLLTRKYGKPTYEKNDPDSVVPSLKRQWAFPTTTIELNYLSSRYLTMISIKYFPSKSSDLDKI